MSEREKIRAFIMENFVFGLDGAELNDSDSFLDKGIIDSTGVLEVVAFLEETYGFSVADEEVVPENFDSVDNLVVYVEKKKAEMPGQPARLMGA
ncbi:MAG: acyl carrier protein [Candidatus Abyssobacteria bacterium SURF_17]|uniref:Acyl carrier protein n=1 Tax=Candidatus Abyssobacteria bacterium SURF_17 TaxID=2093361 RepID=A0A419F226_9BACT|nr:MAG: acyl carrier protein [Candidatus Abyssubacteria bacterium SURF_17]